MATGAQRRSFSGARFRQLREASGYTRERLAVDINKSFATVIAYETGRAMPPSSVLGHVADALGVSPDDFFEREAVTA